MPANTKDSVNALEQIAGYLMEIASFNRRDELRDVLSDESHRRAYELTDGKTSSQEIAADDGVSSGDSAVRNWWVKWRRLGLVDSSGEYPRRRYATFVIDLDEED